MSSTPSIRPAHISDAPVLAKLIDIAGEGIPNWLWSKMAEPHQSPLDVGQERASRENGGFSYRNALVAETDDEVIGMILGYRITEPSEDDREQVTNLPEPIRPFVELEHESVGTFYVNALAVLPGRRGVGAGSALLRAAEDLARKGGVSTMSIQVFGQNTGAVKLYEREGYRRMDSRPVLHHPCQPYYDGAVLLLMKNL